MTTYTPEQYRAALADMAATLAGRIVCGPSARDGTTLTMDKVIEWALGELDGHRLPPLTRAEDDRVFDEVWKLTGHQYGADALENVRLGWRLALNPAVYIQQFGRAKRAYKPVPFNPIELIGTPVPFDGNEWNRRYMASLTSVELDDLWHEAVRIGANDAMARIKAERDRRAAL